MHPTDKRLLWALLTTTLLLLVVYVVLSMISHNYATSIADTHIGGVVSAPFIVIGTIQQYWGYAYGLAVLSLILTWAVRRFI